MRSLQLTYHVCKLTQMVFAMAYSLQITMWIVTLSSPSNDPNLDITQTTISHFLNTALSTTTEIVWPIHCKYVISTSSYKIGKMFKKFISPFPIFSFSFFPILSYILFFTCCYKYFFFLFILLPSFYLLLLLLFCALWFQVFSFNIYSLLRFRSLLV